MNRNLISDKDLVHLYVSGDESAIAVLLTRHKSKIYTSIYLLVKDRYLAEDIFQDTFIKVINTLKTGKYNEEGKFLPWVMRIAHNLVIDHFRKEKRTPTITNSEGFDIFDTIGISEESAEDKLLRDQSHTELRTLIQKLPEEQRNWSADHRPRANGCSVRQ